MFYPVFLLFVDFPHPENEEFNRYGFSPFFAGESSSDLVSKMVNQKDFETDWFNDGMFICRSS
jgi:hypothetical protein